jgi:hypothetical protein
MLLLLAAAARLPGQTEGLRPEAVAQLCRAPENTGNEAVMVRVIDARLHPYANGGRRIHLAVVDNGEFEYHDAANFGLICVPKAAVNFLPMPRANSLSSSPMKSAICWMTPAAPPPAAAPSRIPSAMPRNRTPARCVPTILPSP